MKFDQVKINPIRIGTQMIGEGYPVFLIAEAGVNHNGNIEMAKRLVEVAKESGADCVKFQTFKAENLNTKSAPKSTYHIETTGNEQSWFDLLKSQELDRRAHEILISHCEKVGILFMSTPYDEESADLLDELNVVAYKIASTDANNIPFLRYIAKKKRPIILSTGMCDLDEVRESVEAIRAEGCRELGLLHCTANYPAQLKDTNLNAMLTLRDEFLLPVGYSDHTEKHVNPIAATVLGATMYEKHFTLDRNLPGPDHRASVEPHELKALIEDIRAAQLVRGFSEKRPLESEKENRLKLRKSIVTQVAIPKGTRIKENMLAIKRPGTGLSPKHFDSLIGKTTVVDIPADTVLEPRHWEERL